ncbi:metallophosphoesterase [Tessaracoccus antarcticus]|uniref:Metallophosphoesterase n=1 Tax=Tessaracoccus antarcticus TaxID=2479848 RepID=A0A3M0G8H9_9ACTN|nr:metallophosphoesterase [Tessaracoccus antarcticus]RMB61214.1 metallophosphoesterase [Tessaracoccus antarcticus]
MGPRPGHVLGALGGAALGCFAWGLVEANLFTVRRLEVPVLPPGGRTLRILHVSDLHLTSKQHFKLDFIRSLASLRPDLVVTTGDNIADADAIFPLMAAWNSLRFTPGVFVFGSNDYYAPAFKNPVKYILDGRSRPAEDPKELPWRTLRDKMTGVGWKDLTHRRETLEVNGYKIAFRGTDDAHLGRDDYSAVAGPADPTADLNIGVTHAPYLRLLDGMTADGMDLILAGHTHGGQVCVPGYGALVTNCDLDPARAKGLSSHTHGGHTSALHVSAGVGTSPFAPYRFACRPEVTLLTLVPRPVGFATDEPVS